MHTLECHKTHVIACDLDDSLVATNSRPEKTRRASDDALRHIGAFIAALRTQNQPVYFGSATGRTFASVQELAEKRPAFNAIFHMMDFHITSVGTAIYVPGESSSGFTRAASWPNSTTWDREALTRQLYTMPDLKPQEANAQDNYKISFTTTSRLENTAHAAQLEAQLTSVGLQAEVIVSGSSSWRFVDVLPPNVNKGTALLQLPRLLNTGMNASEESICRVAIGDSMNDLQALAAADVSIIPGNGQPDLLAWAEQQSSASFYIVEEHFAAGALQGLRQHLQPSLLEQ